MKKLIRITEKLERYIVVDINEEKFDIGDVVEDVDEMCGGGQIDLNYKDFAGRTIEIEGEANESQCKKYDNYLYTEGGLM